MKVEEDSEKPMAWNEFPWHFSFSQTSTPISIKQLDYELKISFKQLDYELEISIA